MTNGKLQPVISLNQPKHHCYTLSTTCTLFKLASKVGPRSISLVCCLVIRGSTGGFLLLRCFSGIVSHPRVSKCQWFLSSPHLFSDSSLALFKICLFAMLSHLWFRNVHVDQMF